MPTTENEIESCSMPTPKDEIALECNEKDNETRRGHIGRHLSNKLFDIYVHYPRIFGKC